MSKFTQFKKVIFDNLTDITATHQLYEVDVDKNDLWDIYLDSFPDGTNPMYKKRTEYDCQCCKQFIRNIGSIVYIDSNNNLVSVWNVKIDNFFQEITNVLSDFVQSKQIKEPYFHYQQNVGTDHNHSMIDGKTKRWEHFHFNLPSNLVMRKDKIPTHLSDLISNKNVLKRTLDEISIESINTVLELIEQNSLYRGEEHQNIIEILLELKNVYDNIDDLVKQDNIAWKKSIDLKGRSKIRNTAIGTLLIDLSENMELDSAVKKFEAMVAPTNYKRPTALITKSMIANAEKKVTELGIQDSLQRRYAVMDDVSINNVLFADRLVRQAKGVFTELYSDVKDNAKNFDKVEEISIDKFIDDILPKTTSMEVLLENSHTSNLMSLIAPQDIEAKSILQWGNNFSWSYNGEVTDSIKERVKQAGGNVTGVLRCSLSWFNADDLDIHIYEPNKNHIWFSEAKVKQPSSGVLDVDMNAGGPNNSINPVENITWTDKSKMQEGEYVLEINNYNKRSSNNVGFTIEMEYENKTYTFNYDKALADKKTVTIVKFNFSIKDGVKIIESIPSTEAVKEVWNINTEKFHKVTMVMNSPNHWDDNNSGNKHLFFMLDKCKNNSKTRGLYNEFLDSKLREHRKVFEILGSKMKVEKSNDQLSGLGFSTTQRNSILCKVSGSFNRVIKINF